MVSVIHFSSRKITMKKMLSADIVLAALLVSGSGAFAAEGERIVRHIQFAKGSSSATLKGRIAG